MGVVFVRCKICTKEFSKSVSEYNRSIKKGRQFYCSRSCSGKGGNSHLHKYGELNRNNLKADNRKDHLTNFRCHLRRAKQRNKEVNITLEDLKNQWEAQEGMCPYFRVFLHHPLTNGENDVIFTASLDRIDSRRGYVKGNIQFVSMAANFAKNKMSHQEMLRLCEILSENLTHLL